MIKKELILIGGGGHCKACIDVIEAAGEFRIAGIVDKKEKLRQKVLGYEIIATDEDLPKLTRQYRHYFIAIGQVKSPDKRIEKFRYLSRLKVGLPVIISPYAYVSKHAFLGEGTIVMHNAFINAGAAIGKNCIINTASVIEHDAIIEDNCHISTGCLLNGSCRIGKNSFIGSNAVVADKVNIASKVVIGAGAVVVKKISDSGIYAGCPARKLTNDE